MPNAEVTFPPCTEHSPYWIHIRTWKPKTLTVPAGQSTGWEEVGSLLDTLNDGRFGTRMHGTGPYAEQIAQSFRVFSRKRGLDRRLPELDRRHFRPPPAASPQKTLF